MYDCVHFLNFVYKSKSVIINGFTGSLDLL
uniref:Uncharacterized protein n=1 Tax=Heterorhabditis bacteriophora TaxID=37862 RepID=A0A1I7W6X5_HETBA